MTTMLRRNCSLHRLLVSLLLLSATETALSYSVEITPENYEEVTQGRTVFIKFYSPHCDHCKKLAPDWEKLAEEWKNHPQGLVGEVDCVAHRKFCQSLNFEGVPTLLFGDPSANGILLQEYTSRDKSYNALFEFAKDTIASPICSPANVEPCDELTKSRLQYLLGLSELDLQSAIQDLNDKIDRAEAEFQNSYKEMQSAYDRLSTGHQLSVARMKARIEMIKAVREEKLQQQAKAKDDQ
jgi:thiol-disulfide isomerase/thioredoxin